ncbi:enoyl-CoA hydratase/isomerase family protein [Haloferax sp. KTX1]|uniref:enoyl-CoA hydratase/isomerase family protein n=1 Tax=Haloferax sp. KTX1 TaxID=2600597 RepID=UPI0011DE1310|nr:enoyl-CoA hydratase/isomerase family protein [Haloferax sp. KTX1]
MECSHGYVRVDYDDEIATIVIDGERRTNAIDLPLAVDFREAVRWVEQSDARAAVVRGAGGTYCAGGDLTQSPEQFIEAVDTSLDAIVQMYESGTPYIAAIERVAVGGGLEIAVACDLRVADADATLKLPEASLGIIPPAGAARLLVQHVGLSRARDLLLTGRSISGATAADWGLITRTTDDPESVVETAQSLARTIAEQPPAALSALNKAINAAFPQPISSAKWDLELAKPLIQSEEFTDRKRGFLDQ